MRDPSLSSVYPQSAILGLYGRWGDPALNETFITCFGSNHITRRAGKHVGHGAYLYMDIYMSDDGWVDAMLDEDGSCSKTPTGSEKAMTMWRLRRSSIERRPDVGQHAYLVWQCSIGLAFENGMRRRVKRGVGCRVTDRDSTDAMQ